MRPLRLATGLILFAYATSHLINHAFGVHSVATFQAAGLFLLKPWQTLPGHLILYSAFVIHAGLGLYALYRRRHFRIPADEYWQLALGLTIPILFIQFCSSPMRSPSDWENRFTAWNSVIRENFMNSGSLRLT